MRITSLFVQSVLILTFVAITTQDITGKKGCDCSICKGVDNKISLMVGKKIGNGDGGKSSCNLCEQRKEMLRLERERQRQMQKCPYELLGSPVLKGKSSQEVFDEFRELIVPSQNGFFDMMRGIVRTMHYTSEAELKMAQEKEAKELAEKKRKEEEEEKAKNLKGPKPYGNQMLSLKGPNNPKVTVVLKQNPCGQIIPPSIEHKKVSLLKRLPKETNSETNRIPEEEALDLQTLEFGGNGQIDKDYLNLNSKENLLHTDLIDDLLGFNMMTPGSPQYVTSGKREDEEVAMPTFTMKSSTESSFATFYNNDEYKTSSDGRNLGDYSDVNFNELTTSTGFDLPEVNEETSQSINCLTGSDSV